MLVRIARHTAIGLVVTLVVTLVVGGAVVGGMIWLGGPGTPPVNRHLAERDQDIGAGLAGLPDRETFQARDGTALSYRRYPGIAGGGVVVLVHGSSGTNSATHLLAQALAKEGMTAIGVDIRGHGGSGPHGDIAYVGQLDDDMADLAGLLDRQFPGERRLLAGHSSGGGFVLRIAGSDRACKFDGYVALSPYLNYQASTLRPDAGWATAGIARIVGLSIANRFGIHAFEGLPVVNFAITPGSANRTYSYSFRLQEAFGLPQMRWEDRVRAITRPAVVLVGERDELFFADRFAGVFAALNPSIPVRVTPGVDHMGMVLEPAAIAETVTSIRSMLADLGGSPRCPGTISQIVPLEGWVPAFRFASAGMKAVSRACDYCAALTVDVMKPPPRTALPSGAS